MYHHNRNKGQGFALMLLFGQMAQIGFDKIPPVTLITILGQVVIFLRVLTLPFRYDVESSCISALHVWYREDYIRLILGALQHADEWHLYFNMASMLWKGIKLEKKLGSVRFAVLLLIFTPLVSISLLLLTRLLEFSTNDTTYITQCHVGFSGVLFALKVLVNHFEPSTTHIVMGILPVSAKYVCWVELVLIHLLVPNSSFLGHLAGIIVGVWYVHGPLLSTIIDTLSNPLKDVFSRNHRSYQGSGYSGYRSQQSHPTPPNSNEYNYRQPHPNYQNPNDDIDLNDIRTRRLNRFNR